MATASQQHPGELQIIVDRRNQPGMALLEHRWPGPGSARRAVERDQPAIDDTVRREKPVLPGRRYVECRIDHPERTEEPFFEESAKPLPRSPCNQHALDVR